MFYSFGKQTHNKSLFKLIKIGIIYKFDMHAYISISCVNKFIHWFSLTITQTKLSFTKKKK